MPLCNVAIPSNQGADRLFRTVDTLFAASDGCDFEIRIRLDDDNKEQEKIKDWFKDCPLVHVVVGPAYGYNALYTKYWTEMANASEAPWIWTMNDDMEVHKSGVGWDTLLAQVPRTGYFVEPEFHKLNVSVYPKDCGCGAPIFLKDCWKLIGQETLPDAADYTLTAALQRDLGWKPWFLTGITLFHDRRK
jgi:hypothetical protein